MNGALIANEFRYTWSIVSHGQGSLVAELLRDLDILQPRDFEVVVTLNVPEAEPRLLGYSYPVRIIRNAVPKGFGANHNQAFRHTRADLFAVVNPDIRIGKLSMVALEARFEDSRVAICAPAVVDASGATQDNARRFPTVGSLARRVWSGRIASDYDPGAAPMEVDWVAGMFMLIRRSAFADVGGFDERRFFMYYEDVDLCRRLSDRGWKIVLQPNTSVIHEAQRASHRNVKHLRWHVSSAVRYLTGL